MVEPVFEKLAYNRSKAPGVAGEGGIGFVKVDLGVGMSNAVASEYGVRVTPTFIFFLSGKKVGIWPWFTAFLSGLIIIFLES